MYWIGLQPGDVHLNVSSPGWAKHAWSNVFAPWIAGATAFVVNQARFDAAGLLDTMARCGVTTFCAPPTVWRMLVQEDLGGAPGADAARGGRRGRAAEPRGDRAGAARLGHTVRDGYGQTETTAQVGNPPGARLKPGSMGRPLPGYDIALLDPVTSEAGHRGRDLPRPVSPADRADGRLPRRPTLTDEVMRGGYYHTGDVASSDEDGYITYVGSQRRRVQGQRLPDLAVRAGERADRAPGGRRGGGGAGARPGAARGAQGVRRAGRRVTPPTPTRPSRSCGYAREHLAPYKRVRRLEFAELPKTICGKIRRVELRQTERERGDVRPDGEYRDEDFPDLKA